MSYTQNIIREIRSLTEKIKSNNNNTSQTAYAQSDFINKLLQMEKDYNKRTKEQMPDYDKLLPNIDLPKESITIKDPKILQKEAGRYVSDLAKQKYSQIKEDAQKSEQKLLNQQQNASQQYRQERQDQEDSFLQNRQTISQKMTRQGLTHSSIKQEMLDENLDEYLNAVDLMRKEYKTYNDDLNRRIDLVNTAKEQAIMEFNIKAAAEYEKKLAQLKEEQLKAIDDIIEYNQTLQEEQLKREQKIEALQQSWLEQQEIKEQEQFQKELSEGYSGEKAVEMENRYQTAKSFYKAMDKDQALTLIRKDKEVLKSVLGLHYNRLIKEIQN